MKLSSTPTEYILVRANSQSEWDCCDFAIITCDNYWKEAIKKRLEAAKTFDAPDSFIFSLDCKYDFINFIKLILCHNW